jgi:quinoprotein relay system zinc metallohydrolase 2
MTKHLLALFSLCSCAMVARAASDFGLSEVAPGIFVHQGKIEERTPGNMGDQANIGFIVGSKCVAVVDTGGSIKVGRQLREAIKQTTQTPICYVINTHVHPDHMFGNAAFKDDKTVFVGHERLGRAMAARASNYSNSLARDLGDGAKGSEIVPPQQTVKDRLELDLGGRVISLRAWPPGHTDNDVSVWDGETKTLWLSDLLFLQHIPALDGSIVGWLDVIKQLKTIAAKQVIPGHGPASAPWPDAIAAQERYLTKVLQGVRAALKDKKTIQEAVETVAWDEKDHWRQFENFHRRTVTASYAELEWEE